ncbi:alpha/beta hydrolase [Domibacillus aminovorans]|uniref:Esterase n=1 Tax=Domibacillus aminovorans TaxID=29332 RepID=A0A177L8S6_9BACI|nr:alpha/beta hydrolase-fold protein [Domibacillus aminovorans]OAH61692.1 esterase [Domibacillus aminovorans]
MKDQLVYELRSPENIEPGKKYPAIFLLHGMGSNEQNMMPLVSGMDKNRFVFSIRGPIQQPPGYAFFTIQGFGNPHRDAFDSAINKLENFIEYAVEKYQVNTDDLFLMGFSQGAILSMTLGLKLGTRIKGIIALSGYIPAFVKEEYDIQSMDQVAAFISHGEYDQVLPYEWGVNAEAFYKQHGAASTFSAYPEGHTVSNKNHHDFTAWFKNLGGNRDE